MGKNPENQHYVQEAYLGLFTSSGKKKDYLWQFDINKHKSNRGIPDNFCRIKNFYTVPTKNNPNDYSFEINMNNRIESHAIKTIRNVINQKKITNDTEYKFLLNYISLQILKTPSSRKNFNRLLRKNTSDYFDTLQSSKEKYDDLISL